MPADAALVAAVRSALAEAGDPDVAPGQQAYMKSEMPYHGITVAAAEGRAPAVPACLCAGRPGRARGDGAGAVGRRHPPRGAVRRPRVRPPPPGRPWLDPDALDAAPPPRRHRRLVGPRRRDRQPPGRARSWPATARAATPVIRGLGRSTTTSWLRRTAVICQLGHKADTDVDLLRYADRGQRRRHQLLAPQGDRLGPARVRQDRPRLGPRRGRRGWASA